MQRIYHVQSLVWCKHVEHPIYIHQFYIEVVKCKMGTRRSPVLTLSPSFSPTSWAPSLSPLTSAHCWLPHAWPHLSPRQGRCPSAASRAPPTTLHPRHRGLCTSTAPPSRFSHRSRPVQAARPCVHVRLPWHALSTSMDLTPAPARLGCVHRYFCVTAPGRRTLAFLVMSRSTEELRWVLPSSSS